MKINHNTREISHGNASTATMEIISDKKRGVEAVGPVEHHDLLIVRSARTISRVSLGQRVTHTSNAPHYVGHVKLDVEDVAVMCVPELADHGARVNVPHLHCLVVASTNQASRAWVKR